MAKAPADQFYWNDWERDLEEHPLEIAGAWLRICGKLWYSKKQGKLERTLEQWARVLRVDIDEAHRILCYIYRQDIGSFNGDYSEEVTDRNKKITVKSRRMHRKWKIKEDNRLRQEKHRLKGKCNEEVTKHPSSSSSSPSKKVVILGKDKITMSGTKKPIPDCPHDKIIDIYHAKLPTLNQVKIWNDTSRKNLRARWREDSERQAMEFWKCLFVYISESDFLMGDNDRGWQLDMMWIVRPNNFAKIVNGRYHNKKDLHTRLMEVGRAWLDNGR